MTTAIRTGRVLGAALIVVALVANIAGHIQTGDFAFWNTLGFFSHQSNILAAVVLLAAARYAAKPRPLWLEYARASVATYLVIVTVVFWTLLGGFEAGDPHRWATLTMHGIACVILLVDWLLEGPRAPQPRTRAWVVLPYALAWITVALIRGATDGWVPYPFMDPKDGYAHVAIVVGGIVVVGVAIGAGLFRLTRWRVVTPV